MTTKPPRSIQASKIADELRLTREYWLRTVQPFIQGRRLNGPEYFVAVAAWLSLESATEAAQGWNCTDEGKQSPIETKLMPDWTAPEFAKPERLYRDGVTPESLASVAAHFMGREPSSMANALEQAHELLTAANDYIAALPARPENRMAFCDGIIESGKLVVSLHEIQASNREDSGRLPLLPPVQRKAKGGSPHEGALSLEAIRKAIREYAATLQKPGRGFDCARIEIEALCDLRWQRFLRESQRKSAIAAGKTTARKTKLARMRRAKRDHIN